MGTMTRLFLRMLQSLIFILLSVWVLLCLLLYLFQPRFVYFPYAALEATPRDVSLRYEDVFITTDDHVRVHGWFLPHESPRATLLFFHGNGGNISHRLDSLLIFHGLGLSVLIIDYRGYGRSEGRPSEAGTYSDALAAWRYLVRDRNTTGEDIVLFGRSLGSAVAVWLASRHTPRALILESGFTSTADMGRHYYPFLPVKWLTRIKYDSLTRIGSVRCPILFVHSPGDDIVPYALGRKLYAAANEPKSFLEITGGHNEGFLVSGKSYVEGLDNFLSGYAGL